jgi:hypothetical protein
MDKETLVRLIKVVKNTKSKDFLVNIKRRLDNNQSISDKQWNVVEDILNQYQRFFV